MGLYVKEWVGLGLRECEALREAVAVGVPDREGVAVGEGERLRDLEGLRDALPEVPRSG